MYPTIEELLKKELPNLKRVPGTNKYVDPEFEKKYLSKPMQDDTALPPVDVAPMQQREVVNDKTPQQQAVLDIYRQLGEATRTPGFDPGRLKSLEDQARGNNYLNRLGAEKPSQETKNPYEDYLLKETQRLSGRGHLMTKEERESLGNMYKELGGLYEGREKAKAEQAQGAQKFTQEKELKELDYKREIDKAETEATNKIKEAQAKSSNGRDLSGTIAVQLGDMDSAKIQLDDLLANASLYNGVIGPIRGLQGLNPYSTEGKAFQQLIATTKQIIGKGLEGGVLRKEDEIKYEKILPTQFDTMETFKLKQQQLADMIKIKQEGMIRALGKAGYNVSGFNPSDQSATNGLSFNTEAEANAAGLKPGTEITINGRRAVWE